MMTILPALGQRRTKSSGDLKDAADNYVGVRNGKVEIPAPPQDLSQVNTELEFAQWFRGVETELLDASHSEYQYDSYPFGS